ncbi:conserved hypothetical protein [Candidatus Roizmanbacteria bacterium]|nr:conserved hypothetical protein [Candidatus Roizmanbacteria bacterium]
MDKRFVGLMILFFVVFGVFISTMFLGKNFSGFARASGAADPSSQTSLIFAWPLTAKVGDKVDVNVFVRSANNTPLGKKQVKLVTNFGVVNGGSQESTVESDKTGKASFVLTSDSFGIAELTTIVNGSIQLNQKVTVKFE